MSAITIQDVAQAIKDVAAEQPGHIYKAPGGDGRCYYAHYAEGGTYEVGCIVGAALHKLGVPLETLRGLGANGARTALGKLDIYAETPADVEALDEICEAQSWQDDGETWGCAASRAFESGVAA